MTRAGMPSGVAKGGGGRSAQGDRGRDAPGRFLGAERVPDDRGFRPRWKHVVPDPGDYGEFVVDRLSDEEMSELHHGEYFGAIVDYRRQFPDMPNITRVFERLDDYSLRLWMTDGPQEVSMMTGLTKGQRGDVLVTGLGLGIVQQLLLQRSTVTTVTTIESRPAVAALHEGAGWFTGCHELVIGDADAVARELADSGRYDGYVLDHWDTLGDHLDEKVAFLRLLDDLGQRQRPVSLWGFWWEIQHTVASEAPDTARLLEDVERCRSCGVILGDEEQDGPDSNFWSPSGGAGWCLQCEELGLVGSSSPDVNG
jgi:hypothetical protein